MAEIFGTAASVLQVAEAGASLATTLYNYAKSVKSAEKDINKIAREVSLTASVLQHTHDHLKGHSDVHTCSERAIHDLEDLLAGCKEAFQEVDDALTKSMRPGANGTLTISVVEKLKWPLRSTKLEVLRAHLEKLKTTLLLMVTVLALGSKIARRRAAPAGDDVDLTLDKLQIQSLIHAKEDAVNKYAELSEAFSKLEKDVNGSAATVAGQPDMVTALALPALATSQIISQDSRAINDDDDVHPVLANLELCASAVSRLTSSIDAATKQWHSQQVLEHAYIATSLREASQTIRLLQNHGSGTSEAHGGAENSKMQVHQSSRPATLSYQSHYRGATEDFGAPSSFQRADFKDPRLPLMPPPDQSLTSATYIPNGGSFGPGIGIPPLRHSRMPVHVVAERGSPNSVSSGQHTDSGSITHDHRAALHADWTAEEVQIWLATHSFSKQWQAAFQHLGVHGDAFLDLGRSGGQRSIGFMTRTLMPQIARECASHGVLWDQSNEREEARRLRRLVREVVRIGVGMPTASKGPASGYSFYTLDSYDQKRWTEPRHTLRSADSETARINSNSVNGDGMSELSEQDKIRMAKEEEIFRRQEEEESTGKQGKKKRNAQLFGPNCYNYGIPGALDDDSSFLFLHDHCDPIDMTQPTDLDLALRNGEVPLEPGSQARVAKSPSQQSHQTVPGSHKQGVYHDAPRLATRPASLIQCVSQTSPQANQAVSSELSSSLGPSGASMEDLTATAYHDEFVGASDFALYKDSLLANVDDFDTHGFYILPAAADPLSQQLSVAPAYQADEVFKGGPCNGASSHDAWKHTHTPAAFHCSETKGSSEDAQSPSSPSPFTSQEGCQAGSRISWRGVKGIPEEEDETGQTGTESGEESANIDDLLRKWTTVVA